jgi:hypothetical protein
VSEVIHFYKLRIFLFGGCSGRLIYLLWRGQVRF